MYNIISRTRVQEPNRGQNYSEFYFTTYIVLKYDSIEEEVTHKFFEESEEEIISIIENYTV